MKISLRTSVTSPVGDYNNNNWSAFVCIHLCMRTASTAVTSGLLCRYNEDKTLSWLKKKVHFIMCYVYMLQLIQVD